MYNNTCLFIFTFLHVLVIISNKLIQCAYYIQSTGKKKNYIICMSLQQDTYFAIHCDYVFLYRHYI